jgi:hypothetical protein
MPVNLAMPDAGAAAPLREAAERRRRDRMRQSIEDRCVPIGQFWQRTLADDRCLRAGRQRHRQMPVPEGDED